MGYILLIAAVFMVDYFLKKKVDKTVELGEKRGIFKDRLIVTKYYNKGVMLDRLEKSPALVRILCGGVMLLLSLLFLLLLREKGKAGIKLGFALVIGGGASNLFDRLTKGHVVDYFSIKCRFPKIQRIVFNISDWFIFLGALLVLFFHKK